MFEKVYRALQGYDERKAPLSTWVYMLTRNTLTDYCRTRHITEPLSATIRAPDDVEKRYIREETISRLVSLLKDMKRPEREIIILRYYRGYTLTDIARLTGISYGMVKVVCRKALEQFRHSLL